MSAVIFFLPALTAKSAAFNSASRKSECDYSRLYDVRDGVNVCHRIFFSPCVSLRNWHRIQAGVCRMILITSSCRMLMGLNVGIVVCWKKKNKKTTTNWSSFVCLTAWRPMRQSCWTAATDNWPSPKLSAISTNVEWKVLNMSQHTPGKSWLSSPSKLHCVTVALCSAVNCTSQSEHVIEFPTYTTWIPTNNQKFSAI